VQISVIGARDATPAQLAHAEAVGRALAERGHVLVCGGLGGVMEAACRGARAASGRTVGILPGEDPADANPHVDIVIPTGLGIARNALVVRAAAAVIAIGGAYGTLSEIAFALQLGVPVVGLDTWPLTTPDGAQPLPRAASADEAVELAIALAETARAP